MHQILLVCVEDRLQFDSAASKRNHHDTIEEAQIKYRRKPINGAIRPEYSE